MQRNLIFTAPLADDRTAALGGAAIGLHKKIASPVKERRLSEVLIRISVTATPSDDDGAAEIQKPRNNDRGFNKPISIAEIIADVTGGVSFEHGFRSI
jgi:cell pole-organizing protein PopZ